MEYEINRRKEFTEVYNNLRPQKQVEVSEGMILASMEGHICICQECAKKYFAVPDGVDYSKQYVVITDDFTIDDNICNDCVCEIGECQNEARFSLNLREV